MEYRRLGKSGLKVSALSFGSWVTFSNQVDVDKAVDIMKVAYDGGINFFDNAEIYAHGKSELVMGAALKKLNWSRDSYVVSSKVRWGSVPNAKPTQLGLSRKHIVEACHQGKVFYWGTSEWSAQQLMEAHSVARQFNLIPPTMEQPQYNMFHRERFEVEYGRLYDTIGLGTTIWLPLASGILTGKYNEGVPDDSRMNLPGYEWLRKMFKSNEWQQRLEKVRSLTGMAAEMGTTMARLALAWTLKNPHVSTVILGASRVSQLEDNLQALEVVPQLTDDVVEKIEAVLDNKPTPMEFQ